MFQFSRSLSTGNTSGGQPAGTVDAAAAAVLPGSPYRTSSTGAGLHGSYGGGLFNGGLSPGPAKHSLSKELMQKLRSMTETIKMLSDENEILKRENDRIKDEEEGVYVVKQSKVLGHQNVGNVGVLPEAASKGPSGESAILQHALLFMS